MGSGFRGESTIQRQKVHASRQKEMRHFLGPRFRYLGKRVAIEAGVELGWHKWIGRDGIAITQDSFGASAPMGALANHFGFTTESILERILH